jgi:hypothetical protein
VSGEGIEGKSKEEKVKCETDNPDSGYVEGIEF